MITIKGEPTELLINTVTLTPEDSTEIYLFHCSGCGSTITQYQGIVTKIVPMLEPTEEQLVVNKCRKCGNFYTFQTARARKKELVRVTLHANITGYTDFFCFKGRQPVLKFNHERIFAMSDHLEKLIPFTARCPIPDCPIEYHFVDLV